VEGVVVSDSEDSVEPEELEEGEIAPELDINHVFQEPYDFPEINVEPEVPEPAQVNLEQQEIARQAFLAERLYDPPPPPSFRKLNLQVFTKIDIPPKELSISWEINDSEDFNVDEYPVPSRNEDALHIIDRTTASTVLFRGLLKPIMYWDFISDKDARTYTSAILSWFYENDIHLFVIKRREGCQYVTPMLKHFKKGLSEADIMELGKKKLVNPSNNPNAEFFARRCHADYRLRFAGEEFDKSKLYFEPRSRKRVRNDDGTIKYVQRPIKCMLKVEAKKWPQNILSNLDNWEIDRNTGEAKMYADKDKKIILMRMNDPMQLVNLSRYDQRTLYDTECSYIAFWTFEENRYRKILRICLHANIHADSRRLLFEG